ncbi:AMP-binding protein [Haliea sp. E1-2-M8]|uniref:AMP-binding protein n=1 Tax=Haliea sp. E1-2-M8 TaxID=3064706 RepID=UPI0027209BAD|nr:AMP-binding protein [Haliea sp. E1-2-M8]MDO8860830.1 AMP-binding protein [Haliea sp. E1-2-M8]
MNPLLRALHQRARVKPEDVVLTDGHTSTTATRLVDDIDQLGRQLAALGVKRLALLADNSPDWVRLDLAAQSRGICLVPVPTFFSAAQRDHVLHAVGVDAIASETGLRPLLALPAGSGEPIARCPELLLDLLPVTRHGQVPAGTAKITFTSGSTGTPKGVCLSTEQCLRVASALVSAVGLRAPRHLSLLPMSTLLENIAGVYMPLLAGGSVALPPPAEVGLTGSSGVNAGRLLQALGQWQPQTLILTPQFLALFDQALQTGWQPPQSLRFVALGGARVAPALLQRVRRAGLPVFEGYGLSECASVVSLNTPGLDRPGSSGQVLPHVRVTEREGELWVEGNRFLGYLDDPASWECGPVATGDLGRIDSDGFLTVSGRRKHLLISSFGRNISPEWVESELLAGGVLRQAVVLGDDRPWCVALVYPADTGCDDSAIAAAIAAANERLPDYAQVRDWIRLQQPLSAAADLLTANGRPRRKQIAVHFAAAVEQCYPPMKESLAR